jgi:hypothetical protein
VSTEEMDFLKQNDFKLVNCCYNCVYSEETDEEDGLIYCSNLLAYVESNGICNEHK